MHGRLDGLVEEAPDSTDDGAEDAVSDLALAVHTRRAIAHVPIRARTQISRMVLENFVELNSISHRLGLGWPRGQIASLTFEGGGFNSPWVEAHELCMDSDQARRACQDRVADEKSPC